MKRYSQFRPKVTKVDYVKMTTPKNKDALGQKNQPIHLSESKLQLLQFGIRCAADNPY